MKKLALVCVVALAFSTTAMAVDIAISTQAGWWSQAAADTEMQKVADNVTGASVAQFPADQQDALADWVVAHTGNGVEDLLILCGTFPDTIYEPGNTQADNSLAELFLDDGNTIINTGDWIFYVVNGAGTNAAGGLQTMMDIPGVTVAGEDDTAVTVTAEGQDYTPSLADFATDRPFHLDTLEGDWYVELILAQNAAGTRADPVIVRNSVTGGRIGIFYQTASQDSDPRGEVISEWINNWYLKNVANPAIAANPSPADEAVDVPRDVVLGWKPGDSAVAHDVYLGTSFDDVNVATAPTSAGQSATDYQPASLLEFGTTYYWRVDEVNGAPDNTIFKGEVWSFTTEPFAYPVENVVASTNATSDEGAGPENTVNGSGLNSADQHSTEANDMWATTPGQESVYIQYEFDQVYKLHQMLVWNYNVQFELMLGFGLKDVTVEYSTDGVDWIALGDVEVAQATTKADYTANTTVEFNGVAAQYVRLSVNSGWGMLGQFGLSEVRFMFIPASAREPQPANRSTAINPDTGLSWRAGRDATSHEIYLSTDEQAVADGTALVDTIAESNYAASGLDFGSTYFWKVTEVQDTESWEGAIWSFATEEFAVIDGFESYNDEDNVIYETWIDGWVNETGSTVGYLEAPFAEQTIVNSGSQSMPLQYDNGVSPFYSEAERDLGGMDLDTNGADSLRLFVSGQAPAFSEEADGTILMNGIGADIWGTGDEFRYAYKTLTGDGLMIARVDALDNSPSTWAKAGVMIRQGTTTGSQHAFMAMTGGDGNGYSYQRRVEAGLDSTSDNGVTPAIAPPYWVKIERAGSLFTASVSPDSTEWTVVGDPQTIEMDGPALIGLALTSHLATQATSAQFSNVSFTGNVTGSWQVAEIGATQPVGNDSETVYVAVEDSAGHVAVVTHPSAAVRSGWTEWVIPYSDLAGVNLNSVAMIYVGVGDRDNPTSGGGGTIFVDDIGYGRQAPEPAYENLLANGGFEDGVLDPWNTYGDVTAEVVSDEAIEGGSSLHITVNSAGANFWDSGLQHTGHVFEAGKQYTLSAFVKCSAGTLDINFKPELAADPWSGFGDQVFTMTDEWTEFSVTTPVFETDASPAAITFHIGFAAADFWIDGVRFYEGEYVAP
jgi:carbohydrate binding protein with CBM4/9 domain/F5/8 type C domain-containing protein